VADINRVTFTGRLTRDVELRYIPSGTAVADIGVAINERVKRNDQWVDETTFCDVTLWGKTAEFANERLSKGSTVTVDGRLRMESWEKDGVKRSKLKVVADQLVYDSKKPEAPAGEDEWA
jgi:single-strand DNA-binding protein